MNLFEETPNWKEKLTPLINQYKGKKHPLDYQNAYQLLVMVVLSAQDSDANINKIAPELFKNFPNMEALAASNAESLIPFISKVRNFATKANWLIEIAKTVKEDKYIPTNLENLTALKGIGRKSANVILRETNQKAEGIIADLHVMRVTPRIGLTDDSKDGIKIEKQLMKILPPEVWNEIGMSISFLGREICRPTNPKCNQCIIQKDCQYPFKII
ncbi:MAG TPA: endonuclease III [Flavobacterium sp.]|uniref:endonuclease III domain-containing protein n=1 Tax=unclassified Flavobacterium TaxID=196869 RepID=UPI000E9EF052|nr:MULTISPECIES: endonuclease III [unclassified Flavobacterium]HBI00087.1 DNA lyase [Flavobacterium sp.]HRE78882.1 endonuclease III [Flavobacterium sp.]